MIRPRSVTVVAPTVCLLAVAASLSSCSTFARSNTVAEVNGTQLSESELTDLLSSDLGQALLQIQVDSGAVSGGTARGMLQAWIALTALAQSDLMPLTPETRATVEQALNSQYGAAWTTGPAVVRELAIVNLAAGNAINAGTLDRIAAQDVIKASSVYVDSRYGSWNQADSKIDPFD